MRVSALARPTWAELSRSALTQNLRLLRGMVGRLAERLKQDGSSVEGWGRLMRSYLVLGEPDKAQAALGDARKALAGDGDKRRQLDELAKSLGIEG